MPTENARPSATVYKRGKRQRKFRVRASNHDNPSDNILKELSRPNQERFRVLHKRLHFLPCLAHVQIIDPFYRERSKALMGLSSEKSRSSEKRSIP